MKNLKKILSWIRPIFLGGVILLVVLEFTKLRREISLEEISAIFHQLSLVKVFVMGVLGFLAVSPMIFYDILLSDFLKLDRKKSYIIKRSITVNSFNNLIGFGGVINLGLRIRYYGQGKEDKNLLKFLVKSLLFDIAGLSIWAFLSLIYILISREEVLLHYSPWLFGAILYYPVLFFVSKFKNDGDFSISKKYARDVSLVSLVEWTCASLFFYTIGLFLGVRLSVFKVIGVFVIGCILGLASFIPGGLGSFELVILGALKSFGIETDLILSWLLLYRLFYYIFPFMLGAIFFVHDLGSIFDEKNDKIPSRIIKSLGLDLFSLMLYLGGVFMIFSSTIPDELSKFHWLRNFSPINANLLYQFPSIIFGLAFIILGRAKRERVKRAGILSIIILSLALIYSIFSGFGLIEILYILILIYLGLKTKDVATREQFVYSPETLTLDLLVLASISIVTIYFVALNYRLTPLNYKDFLLIPFERSFLNFFFFFLILIFIMKTLIGYLKGERVKLGEELDIDKVMKILSDYESGPEAPLALVGDKKIYYYEEDGQATCGISLYTYWDRVIVMGSPFGKKEDYKKLLEKFVSDADLYGYKAIFYEVGEEETIKLHDFGFSFIKFGETASIDLEEFSLDGRDHKSQRNVMSKFEKNSYTFEVVSGPFDKDFLDTLEEISNDWLGGRREKGFSLGYFDRDYLELCDMAIVKDADGKILAFANIMPHPGDTWATIDLMRYYREGTPNSIMEYLFLNLFLYFKDKGKKYFEMGMAPLSNVGINSNSFVEEKIAYLVYKFGYKFYSFEGLRAYKEKFKPIWEPIYLSYPQKSWLLYTMIAIFMVDSLAAKKKEE